MVFNKIKTVLLRSFCKKNVVLFLMIYMIHLLSAQQMLIDHLGKNTVFSLVIPSSHLSSINQKSAEIILSYQFTKGTEMIYQGSDLLKLNFKNAEEDNFVYQFITEIQPGNYDFSVKMINRKENKQYEKKYYINVPRKKNIVSNIYLFYEKDENICYPSRNYWQDEAGKIYLKLYMEQKPSLVKFYYQPEKYLEIPVNQSIHYELPDSLKQYDLNTSYVILKYGKTDIFRSFEIFSTKLMFNQKYSLHDQVQQIRLFVNQNEYDQLKKAEEKDLPQLLELFWSKHDPNPLTLENEYQDMIFNRIQEADDRYTIRSYRAGWQTDRGKTLIKYGQPDEIQIENYPNGKFPVEIWIYYSIDKKFYFDDKKGYGNYELREAWKN